MVDDLAVNLGVLHDKIMKASSRSGKDLIQVFDDMCASTYNWASQTYKSRQQFRNEVAVVWTEGAFLVDTIYGYAAEEDQRVNLDRFDTMTKSISELINNTRSIDETSCKKTKDKDVAYYNYTTGKWFSTTLGTASSKGWNEACIKYHKKGLHVTAATPFTNYSVKTKKYSANKNALSASGAYGTTAEVKAMVNRLRNGDTLEAEFKGVGLTCAKYLITSERLDGSYMIRYSYNDWYMDTFEIANAKADGSGFTHDKKHYDGRVGKRNKGHSNWYTKPAEMFVLKYVTF